MADNCQNKDLRIQKTCRALMDAATKLLERRSFSQITVHDLCEEAQISRAAFYAHFLDKYDLLKYWLMNAKPAIIRKKDKYQEFEKYVNDLIEDHKKIIKHLLENANNETFELLCYFLISLIDENYNEMDGKQLNAKSIVFTHFYMGGILNYLQWQAKNNFPADFKTMNPYFYLSLKKLYEWSME